MTRVLVHHAELVTRPDAEAPEWVLHLEVHDSPHSQEPVQQLTYVLPHDTLEWRAAEYGFHPVDDLDEVVETVLMEPFLPAPAHPETGEQVHDLHHPDHLYRADSIAKARAHLRRQVKAARGKTGGVRGVIGTPVRRAEAVTVLAAASSVEDPLAVLKRHSPMSAEHMAVKAEVVARRREQRRRTSVATVAERMSAQELRAALLPPDSDPHTEENP